MSTQRDTASLHRPTTYHTLPTTDGFVPPKCVHRLQCLQRIMGKPGIGQGTNLAVSNLLLTNPNTGSGHAEFPPIQCDPCKMRPRSPPTMPKTVRR